MPTNVVRPAASVVRVIGEPMERFTRAYADLVRDGHPSIKGVLKLAEHHGFEILGPIPSPARGSRERLT